MHSRRLILLLLLILDLLGTQQIGWAHRIGHLGEHRPAQTETAQASRLPTDKLQAQVGHDTSGAGSHACSTCAALIGFDFSLAQSDFEWPGESADGVWRSRHGMDSPWLAKLVYFQSRAPPILQG